MSQRPTGRSESPAASAAPAFWAAGAILTGLAAGPLAGDAAADRETGDAARVDWAAGWVIAGGTGIADRHAPSPTVALGTSRRGAEDAARRRLAGAVGALPLASGGTLADRLGDAAVKARVDVAVGAAIALAAEPETDGSWHVTLAVPLEAIRLALEAPRALPAAGDHGPAVVVVDGVAARPAIGWTVAGTAAATLWVREIPAWARDAPHVVARSARAGAIEAALPSGTPATLYVVVTRR
ncbi:MAG TPA: hypothetical protein VGD37_33155 [Kofleriaceae bacterium]|jgi:hypothetical protein